MCLEVKRKKSSKWYLDSGCSRHMTGNKDLFTSLKEKDGGNVNFGDNSKGKVVGIGSIGNSSICINDVLYVEGLKHNLLSISQLCDKGFKVCFHALCCEIIYISTNSIAFIGHRHSNVYVIDLHSIASNDLCLMSTKEEDMWLWHRRLGHASIDVLEKLSKKDLVKGLPKLVFKRDRICDACALGKQTRTSFKSKNVVSTSRPLQLLHMDLCGPSRTLSLGGKRYCFVIVDDFSRFTWVLLLAHKDEAFKMFVPFIRKL